MIFVTCFTSGTAFGQVAGRLSGSVVDASGSSIPGAEIKVLMPGGADALLAGKTNSAGIFSFIAVQAGTYEVEISASGFTKTRLQNVKVSPIQETSLGAVKLDVQAAQATVEVVATSEGVQTANAEISSTVTARQVTSLPVLDRQVSTLFLTQPGVSSGRGPTVVNGMRTSFSNVTLDGINIQDNFIRSNSLDYIPTKTTIDQVAEITIATSNASTTIGGGGAQMVLSTRSGSNEWHGSAYWYNRNSALSANDWFNNKSGVGVPFLNLNQPGGSIGGKIIRDKLFFFVNYEAFRLRQQQNTLNTTLTDSARSGVFQYLDTAGVRQSANVLNLRGISVNPAIQTMLGQLPKGNSTDTGDQLNTTGYLFNARSNEDRNQLVYRGDYYLSPKHSFTGTYNYTSDNVDRPDLGDFYTIAPPVYNDNHNHLLSLAWRWTAGPTLTNELRGGFNRGPGNFNVRNEYSPYLLSGQIFSSPVNTFLKQGRDTNTYTIQDNASWIKGKHVVSFGFQSQYIRTAPFNDAGILPQYTLGISTANETGLTSADLPGARSADVTLANSLYATLGGIISQSDQTFNVTSRNSGFVPGATNLRHFTYDTYAGYVSDKWQVLPRLTVTLGLRYEYWTRLNEQDSLYLLPTLQNNDLRATLLNPLASFDFAGNSVGRPYYNKDMNNFAPSIGFAYDLTGRQKTVLRGGYSISYVNDETLTAVRNNIGTNNGLSAAATDTDLVASLAAPPSIATPEYKVPRTQEDNYNLDPTAALGMPDPNLRTPYVQQYTFGIQHEIKGTVIEARYLGNHGVKLLRAFDYNQVLINAGGFLDDFKRAQSNGFLALNATGRFNPSYNSAVSGSQPLPVFNQLYGGGLLTNSTVQTYIRQGEVGTLAQVYQSNGLNGPINFFTNFNALGANTITNASNSTYNAFQLDVRRRVSSGLQVQGNYTFSKVLSDTTGDGQTRFEPYLDASNGKIERARAPFDITHVIKGNFYYELPFGAGKLVHGGTLTNHIIGGWSLSGIMTYQSGTPFSILSGRGTLNRGGRSTATNTASINGLTKGQLDSSVGGLYMTGDGPFFLSPSVRGADGRGVASDGSAPFSGQIFYNPTAGNVGNLQRRMFSGPWTFNYDMSVAKRVNIAEHQYVDLRMDVYNLPNHPAFYVGDESSSTTRFNVNQATFGRITSTFNAARIVQFGLYYRF
ncbi:carboxypeptidase regulatory-like domain-containing protein [uncultured Paludibaculum sp.]|uniref:TonB-dependent receptor n=1 Tax=uncultured Paludibaculum sp. TaxID=1765020 RepID=UPI002AAC0430|nr:carboxypeptidase regulatory-like domain-containing protein [uncultured Paludibaculum sp.]